MLKAIDMKVATQSLQFRIARYFIGLLAAMQLLTTLIVYDVNKRSASAHTTLELRQGERVLRCLLEKRAARLAQALSILV